MFSQEENERAAREQLQTMSVREREERARLDEERARARLTRERAKQSWAEKAREEKEEREGLLFKPLNWFVAGRFARRKSRRASRANASSTLCIARKTK